MGPPSTFDAGTHHDFHVGKNRANSGKCLQSAPLLLGMFPEFQLCGSPLSHPPTEDPLGSQPRSPGIPGVLSVLASPALSVFVLLKTPVSRTALGLQELLFTPSQRTGSTCHI